MCESVRFSRLVATHSEVRRTDLRFRDAPGALADKNSYRTPLSWLRKKIHRRLATRDLCTVFGRDHERIEYHLGIDSRA